jgi:hypothetical protein
MFGSEVSQVRWAMQLISTVKFAFVITAAEVKKDVVTMRFLVPIFLENAHQLSLCRGVGC